MDGPEPSLPAPRPRDNVTGICVPKAACSCCCCCKSREAWLSGREGYSPPPPAGFPSGIDTSSVPSGTLLFVDELVDRSKSFGRDSRPRLVPPSRPGLVSGSTHAPPNLNIAGSFTFGNFLSPFIVGVGRSGSCKYRLAHGYPSTDTLRPKSMSLMLSERVSMWILSRLRSPWLRPNECR